MIGLSDARRVIPAAEKKTAEIGQPMNIAVVDEGGNLLAHVRMDGAWIGSIDISINKAFTARAFDIATAQLAEFAKPGGEFFGIHLPIWLLRGSILFGVHAVSSFGIAISLVHCLLTCSRFHSFHRKPVMLTRFYYIRKVSAEQE
mgnify:CR=1 FL=1